jgi:hypothetical protein
MSQLPDFLRPYFWEVDFDRLHLPEREVYVIERVLEYGEDRAIHWLKATVPLEKLAEVVRRSRRLSPNTANLWSLVLDIPRDEVRFLSKPFPPMPGGS